MPSNPIKVTLTAPQKQFIKCGAKYPAFVAGFGCVHPDTKVHTEHGLMRISDIDRPMRVLSWNEKRGQFQLSLSGGAFPKGKASLHRVSTAQGEFVATEHHRSFCVDGKYRQVSSLGAHRGLAIACGDLSATTEALAQLSSPLDDPHCSQINASLMGRYADAARRYGQQLLLGRESDQASFPSLGDAQGLSPSSDPFAGVPSGVLWERQPERTRPSLFDARSCIGGSFHRCAHRAASVASRAFSSSLERILRSLQVYQQFPLTTLHRCKAGLSSPPAQAQNPSLALCESPSLSCAPILGVSEVERNAEYWDMQVLDTNNYVDEFGFVHHNSGKSEVMSLSALGDASHSATALIGLYAPTYDLVRLITAPRMCAKLEEQGIPHKWNKQENIIYTNYPRFGDFVLRTMDNPERIVGYETYRSHVDEIDTMKTDKARAAWEKIIARNRQRPEGISRPFNRVSAYTTPEGFRFVYDRWVRNASDLYEIIQAPTRSNPFLPEDYIDNLRASYPPELIDAYLEGLFVNLTSGVVYRNYSREDNRSNEVITEKEPLHIGQDFNVGEMASAVCVERDNGLHVVEELSGILDTPALITTISSKWPNRRIYIYPDASGDSRKTVNASQSDIDLLKAAGFIVRVRPSNPRVRDRILSVNGAYSNKRLWVNDSKCPQIAESQEQQAYDKNGEPDKTSGHDHHNDALGYVVYWHMPVRKPTAQVQELRL